MIHDPNTVEDTAKVLLDVLAQANVGKVERALKELADCNEKKYVKVEEMVGEGIEMV